MPYPNPVRILVSPLDWGLGHATRCFPLIENLEEQGCEVILATVGAQAALFSQEFPHLRQVEAPSYKISYPRHGWQMPFWLLHEIPRLLRLFGEEHAWCERTCSQWGIAAVISDNRFGAFSLHRPSIYLTHQVRLALPKPLSFLEGLCSLLHARLYSGFTEVWIPDQAGIGCLGGKLSQGYTLPRYRYIGTQTRFTPATAEERNRPKDIRLLALLSGPEPQRSLFESLVLPVLKECGGKAVLVQGKPGSASPTWDGIEVYAHLSQGALRDLILRSETILCRSGYSTLMDLQALGARAVLVPTPGQTEQEYLAREFRRRESCGCVPQHKLSWPLVEAESQRALGFPSFPKSSPLLSEAVSHLLRILP